jgi:DNA-3-methyladenine glycosylase II
MKRDRIMNKLIPQFGDLHLRGHHDPFTTLARSIVGQQVTAKVADVAWKKLLALSPKCTAQIIKAGPEQLAACGLSSARPSTSSTWPTTSRTSASTRPSGTRWTTRR